VRFDTIYYKVGWADIFAEIKKWIPDYGVEFQYKCNEYFKPSPCTLTMKIGNIHIMAKILSWTLLWYGTFSFGKLFADSKNVHVL
jgi:hypothetical protein